VLNVLLFLEPHREILGAVLTKTLHSLFLCENVELFHEQLLAPHGIVVQPVLLQFTESCLSRSTINACFLGFKSGVGKKIQWAETCHFKAHLGSEFLISRQILASSKGEFLFPCN